MALNNLWNYWDKKEAAPAPAPKKETPLEERALEVRSRVVKLLQRAGDIDERIAALREQKRAIAREVEQIEREHQESLPPNPKGTMRIGG